MKSAGILIPTFLLSWQLAFGQATVLSNPSSCVSFPLADFSCPENSDYYAPNRFAVRVADAPGRRLGTDVYLREVRLLVRHTWTADLGIVLESPGGRKVRLSANNGGGEDNFGNPDLPGCTGYMTFSESSCNSIETGAPPYTDQAYRPAESFLGFNDGSDPVGDWTLLICDDTEQDTGSLHFVELVFAPIQCLPVHSVAVADQDTTTVVLTWSGAQGCGPGTTYVEYGPTGFFPGRDIFPGAGGTVVQAGCPPFALTGLLPNRQYDVYIRKSCGNNAFSDNSCALRIQTGCLPPKPTTLENFSGETLCQPICGSPCPMTGIWRNDEKASMKWLVFRGKTPTQGTGPSDDVDGGGQYVYLEASGNLCTQGSKAILRSGCFRLNRQNQSECHFSFNYHLFGPNIGTLTLEASADGGLTWDKLWELRGNQGDKWRKAYISLDRYANGTAIQFRFTGTKGNGSLGDMALDRIAVHGSEYLGQPDQQYLADRDGDGYGNPDEFLWSCSVEPPAGFVRRGGDCNDLNPLINPGMPEVPCDDLDNNCNGLADDLLLPPPLVFSDTICSGELAVLRAQPQVGDFLLWYTEPQGGNGIFASQLFYPDLPPNTGSLPVVYRFYAEAVDARFRCFSSERAEAVVVINPLPVPQLASDPGICPGDSIDLAGLDIRDGHFTGSTAVFYSQFPIRPEHQLPATKVSPIQPQRYYYQMTSQAGCTEADSFTVRINPIPKLQFLPADSFSLCIESARDVAVKASGGTGSYNYLWASGETSAAVVAKTGKVPGVKVYLPVAVTDSLGCTSRDSLLVLTTSSIDSVRREIIDVTTCNGRDGQIRIQSLDGVPPFTYRWQGGNGIQGDSAGVNTAIFSITGLSQGAYRVTITDSSNERCAFQMATAIVNGPSASIRGVDIRSVRCAGARDGRICLNVSGRASFRWSTGDTTACAEGLAGGVYSVTITEANCETVLDSLVVPEAEPLRILAQGTSPLCNSSRDGRIDISVFGGAPLYQYRWNTGLLQEDLGNISAGLYRLTVTDLNGCSLSQDIELQAPEPLEVIADSVADISCTGQQDGFLRVKAGGGTAPFAFRWASGSPAPLQTGLPAGKYRVTVTDINRCESSRELTILEPAPLRAGAPTLIPPSCVGDNSGSIIARATGGTAPYQFSWSDGRSGDTLRNLGVGTYQVLISDRNGCRADSLSIELQSNARLAWNAQLTQPECDGRSDGAIALRPTGQAPFRYLWSRGDTTGTVSNLAPGAYAVRVIDRQGCLYDTIFTLAPRTNPIGLGLTAIPPRCFNGRDGVINLQPQRVNNPPLRYAWNDGSQAQNRSGLADGSYVVTITDGRNCRLVLDTVPLKSPPRLSYELAGSGGLSCKGDSTGFLELELRGGIAPYNIRWTGTSATTPAVFGLKAGEYRAFIQDANGCPLDATFRLEEPAALDIDLDLFVGNICEGDTTNFLRASVSGGIAPYSYRWNNGSTEPELRNVPFGDYQLVVSDSRGCRKSLPSVKVRDSGKALNLVSFTTQDISCFGARDGRISAQVAGGTTPYTFIVVGTSRVILTYDNRIALSGLPANANYSVVVSDARGCRVESAKRAVREPGLLNIRRDSVRSVLCAGTNTGAIFITANGGTPPFAYNWFDKTTGKEVATTEDLVSFLSGTYYAVVTDSRLCSDTLASVTIPTKTAIQLRRATITPVTCKGAQTGAISVQVEGGRSPYRFLWNGKPGGALLSQASAGSYELVVLDSDSCRMTFPPFLIPEPANALAIQDTILPASCAGRPDGAIAIGPSGGTRPYQLIWENSMGKVLALDSTKLTRLIPGNYRLTLTDSNQCQLVKVFNVPQQDSLQLTFQIQPPRDTNPNGSIQAEVTGGTQPYQYRWSAGDTLATLNGLKEGLYRLTVTDARQCQTVGEIRLIATAILDRELVRQARLYPNPTDAHLWLEMELASARALDARIFHAGGKQVWYKRLEAGDRINALLEVAALPPGAYWLVVRSKSGEYLYRAMFVKQ